MREDLRSRSKQECSARPRGARISTGLLVRLVALLVRFTGKAVQSMARFRHVAPGACEGSATANLAMVYDFEVSAQLQLPAGTSTNIVCSALDPENV